MADWSYGGYDKKYGISDGSTIKIDNIGRLKVCSLLDELPDFMLDADCIFCDPPWNEGNLRSFYTKADFILEDTYQNFYNVLFQRIGEIRPTKCYIEIGKEYLADFIMEMRKLYKYVTFYNSTYYHNTKNKCYVVRGSNKFKKPHLDDIDEEDIIEWICQNEDYDCIGDLCMGRGLVAVNAFKNSKNFVGTELNAARLAVALKRIEDVRQVEIKIGK